MDGRKRRLLYFHLFTVLVASEFAKFYKSLCMVGTKVQKTVGGSIETSAVCS